MESEKRKREDDGADASAKRGKPPREVDTPPGDEEVEEFFAILRRIHVAVKYFQRRDGVKCSDRGEAVEKSSSSSSSIWTPSFQREDFEGCGVKQGEPKKSAPEDTQDAGLDLNSDPISDVSDSR